MDIEKFSGNIAFASIDSMKFKMTSRKDDMESLLYLLSYCLQGDFIAVE